MIDWKSRVSLHQDALKRSMRFLAQQPVTSVLTIVMIALVLVLLTLFWSLSSTLQARNLEWQRSDHILLYLQHSVDQAAAQRTLQQIQATTGVAEASLVTPEQGLTLLQRQDDMHQLMDYLSDNPLPFVIDVVPAMSANTPDRLQQLQQTLKAYPSVEEASLDMIWIQRLFALVQFLSRLLTGLNVILAVAVVLIIGNTLRLIIRDWHDEMIVYKLIGASDAYIMRPFLYSGVWYGLIAAIAAYFLVNGFIATLNQKLSFFTTSYTLHDIVSCVNVAQAALLFGGAGALGWLGARLSARKILRTVD